MSTFRKKVEILLTHIRREGLVNLTPTRRADGK